MSVSDVGNFMYFAFGSNLLKERLQMANPSATFHCTGRLKATSVMSFSTSFNNSLAVTTNSKRVHWGQCSRHPFLQRRGLKDHELNFGLYEKNVDTVWHGGVATICRCPGAEVWGVIWTLNNEDLPKLDKQEGVNMGIYAPLEVSVETDKGLIFCRTYQMKNVYACPPSPQYKQVVCLGAKQNGLPVEYLKRLEAIQTNNYSGPSMLDQIKIDMK